MLSEDLILEDLHRVTFHARNKSPFLRTELAQLSFGTKLIREPQPLTMRTQYLEQMIRWVGLQ